MTFSPTDEQLHATHLATASKDHLLINALAGTAKTTTLELITEVLPRNESVLYCTFNVRNKDEAIRRFAEKADAGIPLPPLTIKTLNGLGHGIWCNTISGTKVSLNKTKKQDILRSLIGQLSKPTQSEAWDYYHEIISAIGLAKSLGYIPESKFPSKTRLTSRTELAGRLDFTPTPLHWDLIDGSIIASIKAAYAGNIDYDDQVYMSALFGRSFPRFPTVLLDERQDFSPINDEMCSKLQGSRFIAVGDPWQSIYAFRGATPDGMAKAKARYSMIEATLSICFRCPSEIVKAVHWRVPALRWFTEGGIVGRLRNPTFSSFPDGCAIICRNNAPLFSLALKLLSAGRSVNVAGSEIGPRVVGIMKKFGPETMSRSKVEDEIENWRLKKLEQESKTCDDVANCMRVFAEQGKTLGAAIAYANDLFKQSGSISLTTGHKAKGMEWDVVYHLDPGLIGHSEQELNLKYVIQTRAKREFYEIDSREII